MNIFIPGQDARMQAVREEALLRGHAPTAADDCDTALLSLPDSASDVSQLLALSGKKRRVLHGQLHPSQLKALKNRGWLPENIQENDAYIRQNALISAEGALYAAMSRVPYTLRGAKWCMWLPGAKNRVCRPKKTAQMPLQWQTLRLRSAACRCCSTPFPARSFPLPRCKIFCPAHWSWSWRLRLTALILPPPVTLVLTPCWKAASPPAMRRALLHGC